MHKLIDERGLLAHITGVITPSRMFPHQVQPDLKWGVSIQHLCGVELDELDKALSSKEEVEGGG
jgi:hypothetical protein